MNIDKDIEMLKELANTKFDKQLLNSIAIIKEQDEVYLLNINERQAMENVLRRLENVDNLAKNALRKNADLKSELETYKKIAEERIKSDLRIFTYCLNELEIEQRAEELIEKLRKEVEKDE